MTTFGIPYLLEDRTGDVLNTEFDEIYDRMFFGVSSSNPPSPSSSTDPAPSRTIKLFELGKRSAPALRGSSLNFGKDPVVVLDFAPGGGMGTVLFVRQGVSMPMEKWMRRFDAKGRCFACSDGENYYWTHKANAETEWAVCFIHISFF